MATVYVATPDGYCDLIRYQVAVKIKQLEPRISLQDIEVYHEEWPDGQTHKYTMSLYMPPSKCYAQFSVDEDVMASDLVEHILQEHAWVGAEQLYHTMYPPQVPTNHRGLVLI